MTQVLPEKRKVRKLALYGLCGYREVLYDFTLHQDVLFSVNNSTGENKPPGHVTITLTFDNKGSLDDKLYALFDRRTIGKGAVLFSMVIVDFGDNTFEVDSTSSTISPLDYCRNSHSRTYHIEGTTLPRTTFKKDVPHIIIETTFV